MTPTPVAPERTPAHTLLALIMGQSDATAARSAIQAWVDLGLAEPGVAADGDTDLICALSSRGTWLGHLPILRNLIQRPDADPWTPNAAGQDALDFLITANEPQTLDALLSHPSRPDAAVLQLRAWPGETSATSAVSLARGLVQRSWVQALEVWCQRVGPPSPDAWADADANTAPVLVRYQVPCPPGVEAQWQRRLRSHQLKEEQLQTLMQQAGRTAISPELALSAYFPALNGYNGRPAEHLAKVPHPATALVQRKGLDGKMVP